MLFQGIGFLLMLLVLIAGIVIITRAVSYGRDGASRTSLEILEERYAKGELERDEYLQMRADLQP